MRTGLIQEELRRIEVDGWLFFDHHERDPLAYRVLELTPPAHVTRRWYYYVPTRGEPRKLVHRIEAGMLDSLPGGKILYSSWSEQHAGLRSILDGARRVAMQYSPLCGIPYVATVDAGTIDLVRSLGVEVTSSAELIQLFEARWTPAMLQMHLEAGRQVDRIRAEVFEWIGRNTRAGRPITEFLAQQFVMQRFADAGLVTDAPPIVAVNQNAANPHYEPVESRCAPIRRDDLVLLDLWAKLGDPEAAFYDVTWMAFCGDEPPPRVREVFEVVTGARDAGVRFVQEAVSAKRPIRGFEVDDVVRGHIAAKGLAGYFTHRTGHSIGRQVHGNGANMDNLETHDDRLVISMTCFSVEPGVYLPEFGVRSELNLLVEEETARVTGEIQAQLVMV
ncbi:MAG TPA: M24 family metallopeptidase [Phycisphaerae bacterium]|nr:M24 family metallopeptidase [Phycisphaerae bacterium]HRY71355.1 M24 family metallopeptidase [Phycisphaerae bacterium]HSA30100.1 M24 family metallopeptidase [Phycisphaerae bacterium]